MEPSEIWTVLGERSRWDPWHQQCQEMVARHEKAYLAFRDSLPAEQQELLEDYLAACQELEASYVYLAYELGREQP